MQGDLVSGVECYDEKEKEIMSEKWQLNLMSLALAIGIVLTWITWDPQVVICCMVLSVLRLGALFYEYPELQVWKEVKE